MTMFYSFIFTTHCIQIIDAEEIHLIFQQTDRIQIHNENLYISNQKDEVLKIIIDQKI